MLSYAVDNFSLETYWLSKDLSEKVCCNYQYKIAMRNQILQIWLILLLSNLSYLKLNAQTNNIENPRLCILGSGEAARIDLSKVLPDFEVNNASVSPAFVNQLTWDIDNKVFKKNPDYCILYGGLNEILLLAPMEKLLKSYKELCELMQKRDVVPIIIATLPVGGNDAVNARIILLNQRLMNYAVMNDIAWADCNKGLSVNGQLKSDITKDGYFLNEKGRDIFARNIASYVRDFLLLMKREAAPRSTTEYLVASGIEHIIRNSPSKVNIVMLGNSITEGGKDWNKWLQRDDVRNAGIGGFTTGQLLWHLDSVW